ncbi:hypothetical protein J5N97_029042 [Dioscorea zingiberensis]|uniref:S-acyltransferase n=1 Tax=Dioscorea zingiberensis TaxID=325984 RepID=A0A9D5BZX4_9LILI|nr:hypothetical protein J5N97_029042 [Dioscorea zingiberensis]
MDEEVAKAMHCNESVIEYFETACWGCGLRLHLASYSPIFKCGWCGAITDRNQSVRKADSVCFSRWRGLRDRFFVALLFLFMIFVICAGVWAVYPVVFSVSYLYGMFHCTLTAILSICTILSFYLSAFRSAGTQTNVQWGSYPVVGKGSLENYTFCVYCGKPKSPRSHHCRSCKMCVLDMDHHCPFIGNCVGAANHRSFIAFLIAVVVSCTYVVSMSIYAGYHVWPPLEYEHLALARLSSLGAIGALKLVAAALANSALLLSARGLLLIYLAFASLSVEIVFRFLLGSANAMKLQQRLSSKLL